MPRKICSPVLDYEKKCLILHDSAKIAIEQIVITSFSSNRAERCIIFHLQRFTGMRITTIVQ
ncbi:hypothetical protein ABF87_08950 [Nitrosomonas sp. JL21]|nr:hypothetical protein [Nitrosomonas sp. JL21]